MKRKIFIAIIAALAAMCVLAVSVGAYKWKVGSSISSHRFLYVVVDGVVKGINDDATVLKFITIDTESMTVNINKNTEKFYP